jgi:hypothetical protein
MMCRQHEWAPLHQEPKDSKLQTIYRKRNLSRYLFCARCAKVAKTFQLTAQLRFLCGASIATHLDQAEKWNDKIAT